jgi:N4-gp56 family major capsid protein
MALENPHAYNDPIGGTDSSVGEQLRTDYFYRKALVEAAKEMYFGQMADVRAMPKNMGKTIKQYHYMPILDDRNINDQGIDADGVSTVAAFIADTTVVTYAIELVAPAASGGMKYYYAGYATAATSGAATTAAQNEAEGKVYAFARYQGLACTTYATAKTALENDGWTVTAITAGDEATNYGNLYGSSKDVGTITSKIPALTEFGGRVNRVGMTRLTLEGTLEKFGFFDEYTQEAMDFDSDADLLMHITTESVKAANEITEDQLQIDLLNGAGVVRFTGGATSVATLQGSLDSASTQDTATYDDLVKLAIELDNNRCPKNTKVITGSRMVDTKVINAARYMYIGSELIPSLMKMVDYHSEKAFVPVAQYGAAGTIARGEIGSVHDFRIIVVPEMMHWDAAGAAAAGDVVPGDNEVCHWSADEAGAAKVNVYPMLVVGDGSFTTIGFQTDGKTVKFKIKHSRPGSDISYSRDDPYGEIGFYSIKWYYGFMLLRPERLAIIKTVAEL